MLLTFSFVLWIIIIEFLGLVAYPVCSQILNDSKVAYALSKSIGLLAFGYIVWIVGLCGLIAVDPLSVWLVLVGASAAIYLLMLRKFIAWRAFGYPSTRNIVTIELLFWSTFALVLLAYSFHPEIYWGEKPMDFTFLNFFIRNLTLPPIDPWAAGNKMNYYYFGSFLFALLHKLTALPSSYGFGLCLASIAGLYCVSAFAAFYAITGSIRWSTFAAPLILVCSTFDGAFLYLSGQYPIDFNLYWATSRTIHSPGINEYPLWSILLGDLHAHLIALPFSLTFISVLIFLAHRLYDGRSITWPGAVLTGVLWGALAPINTWDFLVYAFVGFSVIALIAFAPFRNDRTLRLSTYFSVLAIAAASGVLIALPFFLSISSQQVGGVGAVNGEEFNSAWQIIRTHGHWIVIIVAAAFGLDRIGHRKSYAWNFFWVAVVLLTAVSPLFLGVLHRTYFNIPSAPWGALILYSFICVAGIVILRLESRGGLAIVGALVVTSAGLYALSELYFLNDRMNTTFKVNNALWSITGLAALSLLLFWFQAARAHSGRTRVLPLYTGIGLLSIPCLTSGVMIAIMLSFARVPGDRPTLDGTAYLAAFNRTEKIAFDWINRNFDGLPVLLESTGPAYQEYARFTMNTGLPTVLGWEYHAAQRGTARAEIELRKSDIQTIYSSLSAQEALKLLNKYQVKLIVVGKLERKLYNAAGLRKFDDSKYLFLRLFSVGEGDDMVNIYTTIYAEPSYN